jgi:hypothetical protein
MPTASWQWAGAVAGVTAVTFFLGAAAAGLYFGELPAAHASSADVARYYARHADRVELAVLLDGIGVLAFVVLIAITADVLAGEGSPSSAVSIARLGGNGLAIMLGLGAASIAAAAFHAHSIGGPALQGIQDVAVAFVSFSGFPGALVGAGILACVWRRRERSWLGGLSAATVVFQLAATVGLVDSTGPFNPYDGIVTSVGGFQLLAWMLALSALLAVRARQTTTD